MWFFDKRRSLQLISIHIPKTAGTSFGALLAAGYKKNFQAIYEASQMALLREGHLPVVRPNAIAVHGHMEAMAKWKEKFPNAKIVCWIRDPLERVHSLYHFWKNNPNVAGEIKAIFDRQQPSFETFISDPTYSRPVFAYRRYAGQVSPSFFDFVGETATYETDIARFSKEFSLPFLVEKKNQGVGEKKEIQDRSKWIEVLAEEYAIYNALREAAEKQRNSSR